MKIALRKAFTLFIQGFLALLPLIVSVNVLLFIFSFVEGTADQVLLVLPMPFDRMQVIRIMVQAGVAGLFFTSVMLFGIMIRTMLGSTLLRWIDALFKRVPILSTVYFTTKQVVEMFRSGKQTFFTRPVLVEYPSAGIWAIGFNTGELTHSTSDLDRRFTVFIPTTPNPTSGFLAVVPGEKIRELDLSVEDAVKMILTGGMVKKKP